MTHSPLDDACWLECLHPRRPVASLIDWGCSVDKQGNCLTLAIEYSYLNIQLLSTILFYCDDVFAGIFLFEFALKVISNGFLFAGPCSYLRSGWNRLDFIVVLLSIISFLPNGVNLTFLRIFRSLKLLSNFRGMRIMLKGLWAAVPKLANVFFLLVLFLSLMALIGNSMFQGLFQLHCFSRDTGALRSRQQLCSPDPAPTLGSQGLQCPAKTFCADAGFTNDPLTFDSFLQSLLTVVVCISNEGWSGVMVRGICFLFLWSSASL